MTNSMSTWPGYYIGALALGTCVACGPAQSREAPPDTQRTPLLLAGVSLQTVLGGKYLSALNNGGGAITASALQAQAWETFSLIDSNDGALESGDSVFIQAGNGQYFQALNGGGAALNAGSSNQLGWETFKIVKQSGGGSIGSGDVIGLQASSGSWVSAQNGGDGPVYAYGGALGTWEQLRIAGLTPAKADPPDPPSDNPTKLIGNVSMRTMRGSFLGAQNGGGGAVTATATAAQGWETFSLIDINGGALDSGDNVFVQAASGQYLQALNGGGSTLNAGSNNQLGWETFKLVRQGGTGPIKTGDVVGLQASSGAWVSAENGGGGAVYAYGGALGSWEGLVIGIGAPVSTPDPPGWRLVWADEFDGPGIDGSKWSFDIVGPGWVNHELQSYTSRPENARMENGQLVIEGRSDWYQGSQYSSARLKTAGRASFTYGRVEARMQLPGGRGTWPGFWMMPDDFSRGWPACGEIDIMENVGYDQDTVVGTTHSGTYNWPRGNQRTASTSVSGATTGFHVYAVEWFPDRVDYFADGRKYYTSPNDNTGDDAWPFHKNFYVILNLAIGGDWGGARGVDANIWPRRMLVDYVRVYQR